MKHERIKIFPFRRGFYSALRTSPRTYATCEKAFSVALDSEPNLKDAMLKPVAYEAGELLGTVFTLGIPLALRVRNRLRQKK